MFSRISKFFHDRRIDRLARAALVLTADEYESGAFGWIVGYEFKDGDVFKSAARLDRPEPTYDSSRRYGVELPGGGEGQIDTNLIYQHATKGCLLGGIARSAYIVAGRPVFGTPEWDLKLEVEDRAEDLYILGAGLRDVRRLEMYNREDRFSAIWHHNDQDCLTTDRVVAELRTSAQFVPEVVTE